LLLAGRRNAAGKRQGDSTPLVYTAHHALLDMMAATRFADLMDKRLGDRAFGRPRYAILDSYDKDGSRTECGPKSPCHQRRQTKCEEDIHQRYLGSINFDFGQVEGSNSVSFIPAP